MAYTVAIVIGHAGERRSLYRSAGMANGLAKLWWSERGGRAGGAESGGNLNRDQDGREMRSEGPDMFTDVSICGR